MFASQPYKIPFVQDSRIPALNVNPYFPQTWSPFTYKMMQQKPTMQGFFENNIDYVKLAQPTDNLLPQTPNLLDQSIAYPYIWLSFLSLCKKYENRLTVNNYPEPDIQDILPLNLSSGPISPVSSSQCSTYSDYSSSSQKITKPKPFSCGQCDKRYCNESGLKKHQSQKCNPINESFNSNDSGIVNSETRQYSCRQCNKVYFSLSALKMHVRTHTLPCKCTICGKAFSRMWLLTGHMRTHTGEKPFSCNECDRAFADRSNLRAHMQTHSQVKRYQCELCQKTFSRMGLLTKHKSSCIMSQ